MPREDKAAFEQVPTEPVAEFAQKFRIPAKCLLLVYLLLVVYGSLVTRKVYSYSLLEAWEIFKNIPYFSLGADRRQDLLANLVLYVPLGFLGCFLHWTKRAEGRLPLYRAAILLLLGIALATLIEFVQVYFKRTVSLNDLLVESIGVLIGITVWQLCWRDIINQLQRVRLGSLETLKAVLIAYTVLYVLLVYFPMISLLAGMNFQQNGLKNLLGWAGIVVNP